MFTGGMGAHYIPYLKKHEVIIRTSTSLFGFNPNATHKNTCCTEKIQVYPVEANQDLFIILKVNGHVQFYCFIVQVSF